jgi:hypothetical protein
MSSRIVIVVDGTWHIRIVCFPGDDQEFEGAVRNAASGIRTWSRSADPTRELASRLGGRYPAVRVQRRDDLAAMGPGQPTVYAFRDGNALPERGSRVLIQLESVGRNPSLKAVRPSVHAVEESRLPRAAALTFRAVDIRMRMLEEKP